MVIPIGGARPTRRRERFRFCLFAVVGLAGYLLVAVACSATPPTTQPENPVTTVGESVVTTVATTEPASVDVAAVATTDVSVTSVAATAAAATTLTTATPTPAPGGRSMGVVLVDPTDVLNLREWAGTGGPIIATLHPTQTKLLPTGRQESVDGRIWHEIVAGETVGWVHGRYVTETWTLNEVNARWDWRTALDEFANALAGRSDLAEAVSWRGLYVVYYDEDLLWWKPHQLGELLTDDTKLAWASPGASAEELGPTASFREQIADQFLEDYHDPDTQLRPGGIPIGSGGPPPWAAISTPFANFVWVAIHDPGDNPEWSGLDWSTWFVFMELDDTLPKVVGLQIQTWGP